MALNIDYSKNLYDVGPGGRILTGMRGANALSKERLENRMNEIKNTYLPEELRGKNEFQNLQNKFYEPNIMSEINQRNSITNMHNTLTPLQAEELRLKNKFYPESTQADIESKKALTNYRNQGGPGTGVAQKDLLAFKRQLSFENPNWNKEQVDDASSAYLAGENVLPDGSQLPPISGNSKFMLDTIAKRRTTAPLITGNIKAMQGEAELEVLSKFSTEGLAPYGDTILDYSPQQIIDSFKSDKASQRRLGKFIASQMIQFEVAQQRIKQANGEPSVTQTEHLIELSKHQIKAKYPRLSYEARKAAAEEADAALKKGVKARLDVDIGGSSAQGKKSSAHDQNPKATLRYNPSTGDFERI